MSNAVATAAANVTSTWSIGPVKIQLFDIPLVSGDTTATITGDRMTRAMFVLPCLGVVQTSAPTYSGAVATITFSNPAATRYGQAILIGV